MKKRLSKGRKSSKFEKIIEDIKDVKIQGAEAIAHAGVEAFLLNPTKEGAKKILETRPTEPLLQNLIKIMLNSKNPKSSAKKISTYLKKSKEKIAKAGAKLIKKDMNVFTHCHSSTVMAIFKEAKKQKKNFIVYNVEVHPLMQGRITARELATKKIKVITFPDLGVEQALKKCDLFLFGADAFTKKEVANKIGTNSLCKIAKDYNIPRYSCGNSLKFTKKIKVEVRRGKELWDERNKYIEVINPAFDRTNKKFISGIVSEFGVLPFEKFVKKAKINLKKFN